MKYKIPCTSALAILLFIACEKSAPVIVENSDIPLLSMLLMSSEPHREFTYNSANLVSEVKSIVSYTQNHYNNKNQLILSDYYVDQGIYSSYYSTIDSAYNREEWVSPENTERSSYESFEYNEKDQLYKIIKRNMITGHESYSLINCDTQGRIEKRIFYFEDSSDSYITYKYDNADNLILKEHYIENNEGIATLSNSTAYYFDDKNNPYESFKRLLIPGMYTNTNNIIEEVYTLYSDIDGSVENVMQWEYSYEYNEDGYPVEKGEEIEFVYK